MNMLNNENNSTMKWQATRRASWLSKLVTLAMKLSINSEGNKQGKIIKTYIDT